MSAHVFAPEHPETYTPQSWYQWALTQEGFRADATQALAVERLDRLYHDLVNFKKKRQGFLGRSFRAPTPPKGLYFWGGVGRGKSFLMDCFFACLPFKRKMRVHFHHFMAQTHRELKRFSQTSDPLMAYAKDLATKVRVLCFDEFHVSDIADAMILGRLFKALAERGVVMVLTSNYAPDDLYPNGLQRQNFLPTIALIKQTLEVMNVDGGQDYRLRELSAQALFYVPHTKSCEQEMLSLFERLIGAAEVNVDSINVLGRTIPVQRQAAGVVWFDFEMICDGPRAQLDYLEVAREYHTLILSNVPKLEAKDSAQARRFTWLIDVLYDHRVKVVMSAAVAMEEIYKEGTQAQEFFRTVSRLTEMQTEAYLALEHYVDDFGRIEDPQIAL